MIFNVNRFHLCALFTWQFAIFFASQQIFAIFSNYIPEWKCVENREPFEETVKTVSGCLTVLLLIFAQRQLLSGDGPKGKDCEEYVRCNGSITFVDVSFNSAAVEFGWYCGSTAYVTSLFSQVQFGGVLLGTFSFGALSDAFGRKPIAILALSLGLTCNFVTGLVPSWQVLLGVRFFLGLAIGGTLVVVCTYVMEMILPQQRMALRAFFNWGVARLIMTLICMAFPEWRAASIACAVFAAPALLIIIFILPESPTWLHNKGRIEEMRKAERHIAKFAGIKYEPVPHRKIEKSKNIWEMLKTPGLLRRLLCLWCMWFVASTCGYATDLNSNTIVGNLFVNQIFFSVLIAVSKMVLVAVDTFFPSFSRRLLHQGSQAVVCICFLLLTILTLQDHKGSDRHLYNGAFLVINLIGTVFIEYTWDACYLCAVESMETSCRASATGTCSLIARIGAITAPVLNFINLTWPPAVYFTVVFLGVINLIVSYFYLVETKGVNLDNVVIDEHENVEGVAMMEEAKDGEADS